VLEEVAPNLFRIEVPLPQNPLRSVNSYVIRGERNLVVDTGMEREECWQALTSSLDRLGVRLDRTDFFVTHFHIDHMGLVPRLASPRSKVYYHQPEADLIPTFYERPRFSAKLTALALQCGFPDDEAREFVEAHPAFEGDSPAPLQFTILADGDTLEVGNYRFECVQTPGHTIGHTCLYEPAKKILLSGDHVLGDITPNISSWSDEYDALREYLRSLDRVAALDVKLVLPGHRRVFTDLRGRIDELRSHHEARLQEALSGVRGVSRSAYGVAARMTWDFTAPWERFPLIQKWFATGEAWSHLKHLEQDGMLRSETHEGVVLFTA
jgi:glyoxylase-like metal-dependent hydrolase (beta-lactamase superfamily II)